MINYMQPTEEEFIKGDLPWGCGEGSMYRRYEAQQCWADQNISGCMRSANTPIGLCEPHYEAIIG